MPLLPCFHSNSAGVTINTSDVIMEASSLSEEFATLSREAQESWFLRWKNRFEFTFRAGTHLAQKLPENFTALIDSFFAHYTRILRFAEPVWQHIYQMDETPIWMDSISKTTLEKMGTKSVTTISSGKEKQRVTVILTVTKSGGKLPPVVVFKGKRTRNARIIRNIKEDPNYIDLRGKVIPVAAPKATVNESVMREDYISKVQFPASPNRIDCFFLSIFHFSGYCSSSQMRREGHSDYGLIQRPYHRCRLRRLEQFVNPERDNPRWNDLYHPTSRRGHQQTIQNKNQDVLSTVCYQGAKKADRLRAPEI